MGGNTIKPGLCLWCTYIIVLASPKVEDLSKANKVLAHLQRTNICLRFPYLRGNISIVGLSESTGANLPNGSTGGGFLWTLVENNVARKISKHFIYLRGDVESWGVFAEVPLPPKLWLPPRPWMNCSTDWLGGRCGTVPSQVTFRRHAWSHEKRTDSLDRMFSLRNGHGRGVSTWG